MAPMKKTIFLLLGLVYSASAFSLDMDLTDLDGKKSRLSDYRGKWVIVNYWATWCPPCREEMPELQAFHDAHQETKGVVLGLNAEVLPPQQIAEFLDDYFVTYPNFSNGPVSHGPLGSVPGLPTTFLVTPNGEVVAKQVGGVTRELIENFIEKWEAKSTN